MNINEVLQNFNINAKETSVYLATLEVGPATATDIAKKARIQRTYFYDLAQKLIKEGLLRQVQKGGKKLFYATPPAKLVEIYEGKLEQLKKTIPQLEAVFSSGGSRPKISYFEGKSGIEQVNNDTLFQKGEIVGFTTPRFVTLEGEKFSRDFISKRIALGNRVRVIGESSPAIRSLQSRDKEDLRETRILPKELFNSNIEIGIYGKKVFIIDFKEEFGFIIESEEVSHTMKMLFEFVWNSWKLQKD